MIAEKARIAAAVLTRRLVSVTVEGVSMAPTFQDGDRVLAVRRRRPRPGEVVVVESPFGRRGWLEPPLPARAAPVSVAARRWMIKRVVALPGDVVPRGPGLANVSDERVPAGMAVLLGDNPSSSFDSREFGYFPLVRLLGVVRSPGR
ncbi:S26 family signal peptidase [Streptomyces sp. G44]|uniref:S26 family signal peptidase n=1 Tax=Streptomyces sp. G44 TaxID=2807632 RepID=UPI001960126E|nr:S26 family signal peptidase [Streptomyces sp. G44]MBM7169860.1 S26 family signal peptidase [Streptomyces sp. G44]